MRQAATGFTLSELLIALAILGLIAAFTIPKVLQSTSSTAINAIAKEAASSISQAYDGVRADQNGLGATSITADDIIAKINYVETITTGTIGDGTTNSTCAATEPCYKLHNGAVMQIETANDDFTDGTAGETGVHVFYLDPDGQAGTNGYVAFILGFDGRMMSGDEVTGSPVAPFTNYDTNATTGSNGLAAVANPTWFSWD